MWCDGVAKEFLVPLENLLSELRRNEPLSDALTRLARFFKVSTLVILRRLLDAEWLTRKGFTAAWVNEKERLKQFKHAGSGGNFYSVTLTRVGKRFASELVSSTLDGQTLYRDAFWMPGIKNTEILNKLGRETGIIK